MAAASRTALSRIEASSEICKFLLQKKYVNVITCPTVSTQQNDAIIQDVLRLADYISDQCKILRNESLIHDHEDIKTIQKDSNCKDTLLSCSTDEDQSTAHSIFGTSDKPVMNDDYKQNNHPVAGNKEEKYTFSSPARNGCIEDELITKNGESLSTPLKKNQAESPYDRLLNKILSPLKIIPSVQNDVPITPTSTAFTHIEQQQHQQRRNQYCNKNLTGEETLDFSISQSTSALLSTNNIVENNGDNNDYDDMMTEEQGMIYNDISAVVKSEEDDDDDDVFDLLRSVDDWPALKNFVRRKPTINEFKDHSKDLKCITDDQQKVEINDEKRHETPQVAIISSNNVSEENNVISRLERIVTITTENADQQSFPISLNNHNDTISNDINCKIDMKIQEEKKIDHSNYLHYNAVVADLNNSNTNTPNKFKSSRSTDTKSPGIKSPNWGNNERSKRDSPQHLNNHFDLRKSWALAIPKKVNSTPITIKSAVTGSYLPDTS